MCPTRSLHANLLNRCVLQSATSIGKILEKCNPAVNIPADRVMDLSGLADEHAYGISQVILFMVGTLLLASVLLVSRQMKHPTLAGDYCQWYWMPTFLQEAADCFFGVFSHTKLSTTILLDCIDPECESSWGLGCKDASKNTNKLQAAQNEYQREQQAIANAHKWGKEHARRARTNGAHSAAKRFSPLDEGALACCSEVPACELTGYHDRLLPIAVSSRGC